MFYRLCLSFLIFVNLVSSCSNHFCFISVARCGSCSERRVLEDWKKHSWNCWNLDNPKQKDWNFGWQQIHASGQLTSPPIPWEGGRCLMSWYCRAPRLHSRVFIIAAMGVSFDIWFWTFLIMFESCKYTKHLRCVTCAPTRNKRVVIACGLETRWLP